MVETMSIGKPASWRDFSLKSGRGVCSPVLELDQWLPWLERLPGLLQSEGVREIRHSSLLSTGRRTFQVGGADQHPLIIKFYPGTSSDISSSPDGSLHSRSSWDAFHCNQNLWQRNVSVPEPLIFMETSVEGTGVCYGITRLIEGCQPLFDFVFDQLRRHSVSPSRLEKWMKTVVESIVNLHRSGYSHGDLHNRNLLVQLRNPEDNIRVFFIDFDACQPSADAIPPDRAQLRDLADLAASLNRLVPDVLLAKALAQYLRAMRLAGRRREDGLQIVRQEYSLFLNRNQTLRQRVEEYHFMLAEEQIPMAVP